MMIRLTLLASFALSALGVPLASAKPAEEQGQVRKEMRAGNVLSLRDIEGRVLPSMGGAQYLGPEYDPAAVAYRLKFIKDGRVTFVDVDARSGQIRSRH